VPSRPAASRSDHDSVVIAVRAKPRSPVSSLERDETGRWTARLRSPPVDGKANAELIALVAEHFGVPQTAISVISGRSARLKLVRISSAR